VRRRSRTATVDFEESASSRTSVQAAQAAGRVPQRPTSAGSVAADTDTEDGLPGYQLGEKIGEGGFCAVRAGVHTASGRAVAVKIIDKVRSECYSRGSPFLSMDRVQTSAEPGTASLRLRRSRLAAHTSVTALACAQGALRQPQDWRRIGREVRILRRLKNHPAVIHLYDVVSRPAHVYVVQEYARGGSLLDFVRARRKIKESAALRFFLQIVAGLQYCHGREVRREMCLVARIVRCDSSQRTPLLARSGVTPD
jgi:serine/threonine protein kinase